MARRRRRRQPQPRPVDDQDQGGTGAPAPRPIPQRPPTPVDPFASTDSSREPPPVKPNIGAPISVPGVGVLPNDDPRPEEAGYARGGEVVRGYAGGGWIIEQQGHPLGRSYSSSSSSEMSEEDSNFDMQAVPGGSVGTGQSKKKSMQNSSSSESVGWKEGGAVTKKQTRGVSKKGRPGFDAGGTIPTGGWTKGNYGVDATPKPGNWSGGIGAAGMNPLDEKQYMKPDWAPAGSRPIGARPNDDQASTGFHIRGGQGLARGGAVAKGPGFDIDYTSPRTDPVARRRYSPKHVGYADGGDVGGGGGFIDPMDYIPDPMQQQQAPQQSRFDEYNMIGRQEPQVNPMLSAGSETGYAAGGSVRGATAPPIPAYTESPKPTPSAANAQLYADMDAQRQRTINPPPLQMPALPTLPQAPAAQPVQIQTDQGGGTPYPGYPPITGTVVTPPKSDYNPNAGGSQPTGDPAFDKYWNNLLFDSARSRNFGGFAEGGEIPEGGPPQGGEPPDVEGYVNGDNAMDPEELDQVLQQIAQIDPNQSEDVVNLNAIIQAAQSGDMDRASSILAGFRQRFDRLNAVAQGAAAHGDLVTAAQLAGKAHSQVPDGLTVKYVVGEPNTSVTATVSPSGMTFEMSGQQFHDYLVGPATDFDHILENGLEKNLSIASGSQGQPGGGTTGFAAGGEEPPPGSPMAAGGGVSDDPARSDDPLGEASMGPPAPSNLPRGGETLSQYGTSRPRTGYARGGPVKGYDEGGDVSYQPDTSAQEEQRRQAEAAAQAQAAQEAAAAAAQQQEAAREQRQQAPQERPPDTMGGANAPGMRELQPEQRPERSPDMMGGANAPGMGDERQMVSGDPRKLGLIPENTPYDQPSPSSVGREVAGGQPDSKKTVQDVLAHTRSQYGMGTGPTLSDISKETAGLGLGGDRVAPLTGDEVQVAGGGVQMGGGTFAKSSQPEREGTAGAGGVYYPPGYSVRDLEGGGRRRGGGGGGGGGGHRRSGGGGGGGGGQREATGSGQQDGGRFSATHNDPNDSTSFTTRDLPQNYTTGYRQEPPTYTPLKPGDDQRRVDTEGNPIGPRVGDPVPPEATAPDPNVRRDTQGREIGGFDSRPDPNTPEAYAKREFPNDPKGQDAVLANFYLKGTQREYDALKRAGENRQLTPDMQERLDVLEKGRKEATYDWDGFAKEKGLKSAEQIIEGLKQERLQGGGGRRSDAGGGDGVRTDRSGRTIGVNGPIMREHSATSRPGDEDKWHPKYGRTVLDADGWPTGIPRGGSFANVPWSTNRDYSEPIAFGRTGHVSKVGRAGSVPVYDAGRSTYDVDLRTGRPRAAEGQMEGGWHGPQRGQRGWSGTYPAGGGYTPPAPPAPPNYQTRPVAPQSQAPAGPTSGPNATVGAGPENAPPYRTAGSDWQPVPQPRPVGQAGQAGQTGQAGQRVDAGPDGDYSHIAGPIRAARGTPEYDGTLAARHAHFNPDPDRVHTDPSGRQVTEREMNTQADHTRGGGSYQTSPNGIRQRAEFVQKLENTRREYAGLDPKSDRARELAGYGGGLMQGLANFDRTGWWGPEGGRGSKPSTPNEGMAAGNLFRRAMEGGGGGGERGAPAPAATSDWAPAQQRMAPRPVPPGPTSEAPTGGAPATAQADPENAPPYQTAGKDWEPVPTQAPANTPAPTATTPPAPGTGATTQAPAEKPPAGPPGAVFAPGAEAAQGGTRPWQPPPGIRGSSGVAPPANDMSPAAQAFRAFPSAAQESHRTAYQVQLERQAKEDQLKRETLTTKDTPADRMARAILAANTKRLNNMDTNSQRQYATDMQKVIADDKLFEHAREQIVKEMGDAVGELMKNYRNGVAMMGSKYVPTDQEKGAMIAVVEMMNRQVGAPTASPSPARPQGATVDSPAVRTVPPAVTQQPNTGGGGGMPNLNTYTGATPPWAAPQGQKWQQSPSTKLWRLAPQ